MKRKDFLRNVAVGTAAAFVGLPLLKAEPTSKFQTDDNYFINQLDWSNYEGANPVFVDSNLWIRKDNQDILTEVFANTGTLYSFNYTNYVEIIQMGIAGYEWPTGGTGRLLVWEYDSDGRNLLYSNETRTWVDGPIQSFAFTPNGSKGYTVDCGSYYNPY